MGHESYLYTYKLNTVAGSGLFDGACDRKPGARIRVSSESEPLEFGAEANTNLKSQLKRKMLGKKKSFKKNPAKNKRKFYEIK